MYGLGVILGIIVAGGGFYEIEPIFGVALVVPSQIALLGFFTALFIQAGTFALNDFCDLESDIANNRIDRPLVRGELRTREALLVAILATVLGIICASFLDRILFLLALISAALGILYDLKMKEFFAVGNIYIAFTMAIPFIFGGLIVEPGRIEPVLLILSSIAFLAGFGREVMKDIGDVKGDALRNIKSIARIYGADKARSIVVFSYSLAVILSVIPFFMYHTSYFFNPAYLIPVIAADMLLVHTCFKLQGVDIDYNYMRRETLIAFGIGLFAFVSGALVCL